MRGKLLLLSMLLLAVSYCNAQYTAAIGAIGGKDGSGLTYKHFLQPEQNLQFNALYKDKGGIVIGLFEFHNELHSSTLSTTMLSWSYGFGLHGGYFTDSNKNPGGNAVFGIDAVIGMELQLWSTPFTLSAQLRPNYNFVDKSNQDYFDGSVMLRYIIFE